MNSPLTTGQPENFKTNWLRYGEKMVPDNLAGLSRSDLICFMQRKMGEAFPIHWQDFVECYSRYIIVEGQLADLQERCKTLGMWLHQSGIDDGSNVPLQIKDIVNEFRAYDPDPVTERAQEENYAHDYVVSIQRQRQ
jgi:hypothetical protein